MNARTPSQSNVRHRRRRLRRAGMSLGEVIIGLSIASAVLVAAGTATNSAFTAYAANQEQSSLTQRSRLAMHRMLTSIRTGTDHLPDTTAQAVSYQAGTIITDGGFEVDTEDGTTVVYRRDAATGQLLVEQPGHPARVLLEGVEAFTVKMEPMKSAKNAKAGIATHDLLRRATITLTIRSTDATTATGEKAGAQSVTISSAVVPRRNAW